MTQLLEAPADERASVFARGAPPTLVVGVDGSPGSAHAIRAAMLIAERTGSAVRLIAVAEPVPMVLAEAGISMPAAELDLLSREELLANVYRQLHELTGDRMKWTPEMFTGDPATILARVARATDRALMIVGRNEHGIGDRLLGRETLPRLLRLATVPVLVAGKAFDRLPRRIVAGVDFSLASLVATHAALELFPDVVALSLVHVRPAVRLPAEIRKGWEQGYTSGARDAFDRFIRTLGASPLVTIERVALDGNPSRELAEFAEFSRADLTVVGTRIRGLFARIFEGAVGSRVARIAGGSVLMVPERTGLGTGPQTGEHAASAVTESTHDDWARLLAGYAERNAGRRVSLEVDDPSVGAQAQVVDYLLIGADYDRRTGRVEIMLGDGVNPMHHLTHAVGAVRTVDLLRDDLGRDVVLRIAHGAGQSLVTAHF